MERVLKPLLLAISALISSSLYSQKSNSYLFTDRNNYQPWDYQDFVRHNVRKIEAYSFRIKKNGTVSNKKVLIYRQQFDRDSNKIYGVDCNTIIQAHGPAFLRWYKFERFYNRGGNLLKEITEPTQIEKRTEYGDLRYDIDLYETIYKYDTNNRLTKRIENEIDNYYSVSKYTKDTFHLLSVHPKIYEYYYNSIGDEVSVFHTDDSTRYMPTKHYKPADSIAVRCSYCDPRYMSGERAYENGKLKLWTWYTREGKVHSKKYYYYDSTGRISKQVDSTGWYLERTKPSLEQITSFNYSDSGKTVLRAYKSDSTITTYDNDGRVRSACYVQAGAKSCSFTNYTLIDDKIATINETRPNGDFLSRVSTYTIGGLLSQEKTILNGKTVGLVAYVYEF